MVLKLSKHFATGAPQDQWYLALLISESLPYYFHSEQFHRIDHYIIVLGTENERVWICDTEGFSLVLLKINTLLDAWRGDQIPEGRGEFVMRRIVGAPKLSWSSETYVRTLKLAIRNMTDAQELGYGGAKSLRTLAGQSLTVEADSVLRRGLTYVIPTRIQRCFFMTKFFQTVANLSISPSLEKACGEAVVIVNEQIRLYSRILADFMEKTPGALLGLNHTATLEERLTDLLVCMGSDL